MPIEGERRAQAQAAHQLEARAIHQAEVAVIRRQNRLNRALVILGSNPADLNHRKNLVVESSESIHPEAPLDEGKGLDDDIVAGGQVSGVRVNLLPLSAGRSMEFIVAIQHRVESRGVDEDRQEPKASAK